MKKAFLLAAGTGSRLRPLTDTTPKCLVEIDGRPMLSIWFDLLVAGGIESVLINTHHLPEKVEQYVSQHAPAGLKIELRHEKVLLGSAGTIRENRQFVHGEDDFLVIYADNLCNLAIRDLVAYHRAKRSEFTMGLFHSPSPKECGIATLDENGLIISFVEKPSCPSSDLANAGIYAMRSGMLDLIPDRYPVDFGYDVIPGLTGRMYGFLIPGYYMDIGSWDRLEKARREWPEANSQVPSE